MTEEENISQCSPLGSLNESQIEDNDDDSIISEPFVPYDPEKLKKVEDTKWDNIFNDISDVEEPRMRITERIKLMDEEEKRRYEEAYSRGLPTLPDNFVPKLPPTPPTKEELEVKQRAWLEKRAQIEREKEAYWEEERKKAHRLHQEHCKIQKENRTRDYYWKPDPLYYLHLRTLGYSKIASDKALFCVDNRSVDEALKYLKENPNPTELTKEEVVAAGEQVLSIIRPKRPSNFDPFKENLQTGDEMEIEDSQIIGGDLLSSRNSTQEDKTEEEVEDKPEEEVEDKPKERVEDTSEEEVEDKEDKRKRGVKRNYLGEEVKTVPKSLTNEEMTETVNKEMPEPVTEEMPEPAIVEQPPEYQMIFVSNSALLMDSITLSLEMSKVTVKIMDKLIHGGDQMNKIQQEWIKAGSTMNVYKGINSSHIYTLQKQVDSNGYINYMAECSHHQFAHTLSPTVLGIFGEKKSLQRVSDVLQKLS